MLSSAHLNRTALLLTLLFCLLTLAGAGARWWLYERVEMLPGDLPLLPRGELLRTKDNSDRRTRITIYTCRAPLQPHRIGSYYSAYFTEHGWQTDEKEPGIYEFISANRRVRLVLHRERTGSSFTLSLREVRSR